VIGGPANVSLRSCVKVMALYKADQVAEARELQAIVARGDWIAIKGSFVAVKCALQLFYGYWGVPRKPVPFPARRA
jgi:dihydrodipicolinate synthase/N-acetylneuraminate lyase